MSQLRLIGAEGEQIGVVSIQEALKLAQEQQLDLVEIAPQATPPVCRVMDYSKYRFEQHKKEREAKKKQKVIQIKELRFKPTIAEHDYQVKLKHLEKFLKHHDKVKVRMIYRGREMAHMELGQQVLDRLIRDSVEIGELEKSPFREGRSIVLFFKPKA